MARISSDDLIETFGSMTLLELSEFIKTFESTFGVTAAVPVPAPGPPPAVTDPEYPAEEQDEFDVLLDAAGDKKIQVIKEVRALARLGLKEAKDLVDGVPAVVLSGVSREDADRARRLLEAAGAVVTVR